MMYFSYTCLAVFLLSKFLIKKCTAGEYCVHLLKRDDVVYNVYTWVWIVGGRRMDTT